MSERSGHQLKATGGGLGWHRGLLPLSRTRVALLGDPSSPAPARRGAGQSQFYFAEELAQSCWPRVSGECLILPSFCERETRPEG